MMSTQLLRVENKSLWKSEDYQKGGWGLKGVSSSYISSVSCMRFEGRASIESIEMSFSYSE